MKESLFIQIGNYSNFVGAHFWNSQNKLHKESNSAKDGSYGEGGGGGEEGEGSTAENNESFDSSQLFRCGQSSAKAVYTPRVIFVDLRQNLGYINTTHGGGQDLYYDEKLHDDGEGHKTDSVEKSEEEEEEEYRDGLLWDGRFSKLVRDDVPQKSAFQQFLEANSTAESYR